jgi:hypothetical protein
LAGCAPGPCLEKALKLVPFNDPEPKTVLVRKLMEDQNIGREKAEFAFKELEETSQIFDRKIKNPMPKKRSLAGWARTPESDFSEDSEEVP